MTKTKKPADVLVTVLLVIAYFALMYTLVTVCRHYFGDHDLVRQAQELYFSTVRGVSR